MQPVTKDELLKIIDAMRTHVAIDDSFEGFLNYLMPYDENEERIENADFIVEARYRVGNSMGQGGMQMIGVEIPTPPDPRTAVVQAAREVLRSGEHDGDCNNLGTPKMPCTEHIAAYDQRRKALTDALATLDGA